MEKESKVSLNSDRLFSIMDIQDVREELVKLKESFEEIVSTTNDQKTKYRSSYSALALAEASNLLTHIMRHPESLKMEGEE